MFVPCFEYFAFRDLLLQRWDRFMDAAARHGMTVMPTFSLSILDPDYDREAPGAVRQPTINFKYAVHGGQWRYPGVTSYRKNWPESKKTAKEFIQGLCRPLRSGRADCGLGSRERSVPARSSDPGAHVPMGAGGQSNAAPDLLLGGNRDFRYLQLPHLRQTGSDADGNSQGKAMEGLRTMGRPALCTEFMARTYGQYPRSHAAFLRPA